MTVIVLSISLLLVALNSIIFGFLGTELRKTPKLVALAFMFFGCTIGALTTYPIAVIVTLVSESLRNSPF